MLLVPPTMGIPGFEPGDPVSDAPEYSVSIGAGMPPVAAMSKEAPSRPLTAPMDASTDSDGLVSVCCAPWGKAWEELKLTGLRRDGPLLPASRPVRGLEEGEEEGLRLLGGMVGRGFSLVSFLLGPIFVGLEGGKLEPGPMFCVGQI
eukprot:1390315-Amorphochlora_amoeboformis.AAC.1